MSKKETKKEKENKIIKGNHGEETVYNTIAEIKKDLCFIDPDVKVLPSVILDYLSPYGPNGIMTAEIDLIIITCYLILLVEIKTATFIFTDFFQDFKSVELSALNCTDKQYNPVFQNQKHKNVFCGFFSDIDRDKIVTLEILLGNKNMPRHIGIKNDFILGMDNYDTALRKLLSYNGRIDEIGFNEYKQFGPLKMGKKVDAIRSTTTKEGHKTNTNNYNTILSKLGKQAIPSNAGIICPVCGTNMYYHLDNKIYKPVCPCCHYQSSTNKKSDLIITHNDYPKDSIQNIDIARLLRFI